MSEFVDKPRFDDGSFIKDKLGSFWNRVRNTEELGAIWQTYAQVISAMLQRLYQLDADISLEDIEPNTTELGEKIPIDDGNTQRLEVDNDAVSVPEIHSKITYPKTVYFEGIDYQIVEEGESRYADFLRGTNPVGSLRASDVGTENENYVYVPIIKTRGDKIEQRFGALTGIEGGDSQQYLQAVRGLWYALHFGPTPHNLRVALYILFGFPYVRESGVVRDVDRENNTVTINGAKDRDHLRFNPNFPQFEKSATEIGGNEFLKIDMSDHLPDPVQTPYDLRVGYRNETDPKNYNDVIDREFWRFQDRNLLIRRDVINSIDFECDRLFFVHHIPKPGEVQTYHLDRLFMRDDLREGMHLNRFDLLAKNIIIKDLHSHENEWIVNQRPPGLFRVIIDGAVFAAIDSVDEIFEFFERFKPSYSDFEFLVKRLPIHVTALGDTRPENFWREAVRDNAVKLYETDKEITPSLKIVRSPERYHDGQLESSIDHYIYWDHYEHQYSQNNDIPKTWGELNEAGRQWDEYHAEPIPNAKWDCNSGILSLEELNETLQQNPVHLEVNFVSGTVASGTGQADIVRENIEGNPDLHGAVDSVDLQDRTFSINGFEVQDHPKTLWGEGPHWDQTDLDWDQTLEETAPVWDNYKISFDREWGGDSLEWDPDFQWPEAPYLGTVTWGEYGERWDLHTLFDAQEVC